MGFGASLPALADDSSQLRKSRAPWPELKKVM
jgi:hypothetical protein